MFAVTTTIIKTSNYYSYTTSILGFGLALFLYCSEHLGDVVYSYSTDQYDSMILVLRHNIICSNYSYIVATSLI